MWFLTLLAQYLQVFKRVSSIIYVRFFLKKKIGENICVVNKAIS